MKKSFCRLCLMIISVFISSSIFAEIKNPKDLQLPMDNSKLEQIRRDQKVKPAEPKTFEEQLKLAHRGHTRALYHVGYQYAYGTEVPHNYAKAYEYMRRSAEKGYPDAQYMLGMYYTQGIAPEFNRDMSNQWLESAAKRGNADAMYELGLFHSLDNKPKSLEYFGMAAELGHEPSISMLKQIQTGNFERRVIY